MRTGLAGVWRIIAGMNGCSIKARLVSATVLLALLAACASGSRQVSGELPLVTLEGLERQNEQITLLLGLRNINDRTLPLTEVKVELSSGDDQIVTARHQPDFEIGPRGREVFSLRASGEPAGLALLDRFSPGAGERNGREQPGPINWTMQVHLTDDRGRTRTTEARGFLHPVPGQPGRFR